MRINSTKNNLGIQHIRTIVCLIHQEIYIKPKVNDTRKQNEETT